MSSKAKDHLLAARIRAAELRNELLRLRLCRERSKFVSRLKAAVAKRALCKMAAETIGSVIPALAEEIEAALQKGGGVEAVSALIEAKRDELDDLRSVLSRRPSLRFRDED